MQQNMVAINPFLVSNKNYGILWENYSISHFCDPREYQHIDMLKCYDENGSPGGLTAEYPMRFFKLIVQ